MSFLETWQKKQEGNDIEYAKLLAKDKDVVIIGGGDTGCDCIATSLRHVSIIGGGDTGCDCIATSLRHVSIR